MFDRWAGLGCPDVDVMLAEIASYDIEAAALARAVWESIPAHEQDIWREQLAAAVLSYRGPWHKSMIGQIAIKYLARLNDS